MAAKDSTCAPAVRKHGTRLNIARELAAMEQMSVNQLQTKYVEVFGERCRSRHKRYLIRRIAWRLQANAEGGLSERARRRAAELANDAEIRVTPPRETGEEQSPATTHRDTGLDPRLPPPGNWIEREYKGRMIRVLVTNGGFEYDGQQYRSLSAIAKAVTSSHINGFLFFRLGSNK